MSNDSFEIEYRGHVIQIGQKDTLKWGVSIDKDFDIVDDTFDTRAHALAAAAEWIDKVEQLIEDNEEEK